MDVMSYIKAYDTHKNHGTHTHIFIISSHHLRKAIYEVIYEVGPPTS